MFQKGYFKCIKQITSLDIVLRPFKVGCWRIRIFLQGMLFLVRRIFGEGTRFDFPGR